MIMSISSAYILIGYVLTISGIFNKWINLAALAFWVLLMLSMLAKRLGV
jgi:hypothetical protein